LPENSEELSKVVPVLIAALICDVAAVDPASGKKSLIGVFDKIISDFPIQHPMTVYFKIADGEGKYQLAIRFLFRATNALLAEVIGELVVPDRLGSVDHAVAFPPLPILNAGRYEFHIFANSVFIGAAFLDAVGRPQTG
jgi:hypothetical protein